MNFSKMSEKADFMKKFFIFIIISALFVTPVFSAVEKTSEDYLKSTKHPFKMTFIGESIVTSALKHALKKEAPGHYKIKFKGYSLATIKKGIFKYLDITGKNVTVNEIESPYFNLKTVTDYNWIDYNQSPIVFKSDMEFDYILHLSEKSINMALESEEYKKVLRKVNKRIFPFVTINEVRVKIHNDKMRTEIGYNFPLAPATKDRNLSITGRLEVRNNEIYPYDLALDNTSGSLPLQKVINLVNMLNPLNFTLGFIDDQKCKGKIEEVKILDDIVIINGKIYVKGEK